MEGVVILIRQHAVSSLSGGQTAPTLWVAPTGLPHGQSHLQFADDLSSTGCSLMEDHCPGAHGVQWIRRPQRSPTPLQEAVIGCWHEFCWASLNQRQGPAKRAQYWKQHLTMEIYCLGSLTPGHCKSYLIFFMSLLAAEVCTPSSADDMATTVGPCHWGSNRSRQSAESSSSHPTSQGF